MDRAELIRRLNLRKAELTRELGQQIHHIEEVEALIQVIEGREITLVHFPPQNPFRDIPVRRIDTDTYLLIARRIIGNQVAGQARVPGAERPASLQELEQRLKNGQRQTKGRVRGLKTSAELGPTEDKDGELTQFVGLRKVGENQHPK